MNQTMVDFQNSLFQRILDTYQQQGVSMEEMTQKCGFSGEELSKFLSSNKKEKNIPNNACRCMARIWDNNDDHKRCTRKCVGDSEFCGSHGKKLGDNTAGIEFVWQKLGRVDAELPPNYRSSKKHKKDSNVDDKGPKKPKTAYFCFMDEMRPKLRQEFPNEKMSEITKKLGQQWKELSEDDKKPYLELAHLDKIRYQNQLELQQPKPVLEESKPIMEESKPVVVEVVQESKPIIDEIMEVSKPVVKVVEEPENEDSDDEISVIPYTYNGTQYLLDPESKKVYNMEQEFIGKLEKKKINFDAVDSDDED